MQAKPVEDTEKLLLRPRTVAAMLEISLSQAYKLMGQGVLKSVHLGASVRVPARSLREYIDGLEAR